MEAWPAWKGWRGILNGLYLVTALRAEVEGLLHRWGACSRRCGSRAPLELCGSGGESPVTSVLNGHPPSVGMQWLLARLSGVAASAAIPGNSGPCG